MGLSLGDIRALVLAWTFDLGVTWHEDERGAEETAMCWPASAVALRELFVGKVVR